MKRYIFALSLLFLPTICLSQEIPKDKFLQEIEKRRQEEEKKFLEELRERDPQAYNQYLETRRRQQEREKIRRDYKEGKISLETAKSCLRPLIEKEIDPKKRLEHIDEEINMLEEQIKHLKKRIERLQNIKKNPNLIIEEEIKAELAVE
ncbi:MAG: hypothetical protein NC928_03795 [Candidatus Omnitrophica bacterium]|nr:hypothetical protein [Candidatus Omnitrophota bacterium]